MDGAVRPKRQSDLRAAVDRYRAERARLDEAAATMSSKPDLAAVVGAGERYLPRDEDPGRVVHQDQPLTTRHQSDEFFLSTGGSAPMYQQIVDQVSAKVMTGDWRRGRRCRRPRPSRPGRVRQPMH